MGKNIVDKIIASHRINGEDGGNIDIRIDQTLTQDSTGTMVYLQLEALGIKRVKTKLSVAYIDHNTLQTGFENADDHRFIQSAASRYGIYFSRPGNGICHQVHLERFGRPGWTLLGSDSHTPTNGALGMLAIGAGGMDVAAAMAGGCYTIKRPKVCNIRLNGKLEFPASAKDVILKILRIMSVKGGVGKIIEYSGPGVRSLTVPERATIANMGAELGATTSIFPSDEITRLFLISQGRGEHWVELEADEDAEYDETIEIDLDKIEPMVARPHSPDNVVEVRKLGKVKLDQVAIGSCTNSSYSDLMKVAAILRGKKIHPDVSLVISPGSRQVLNMLANNGALADMISAGARILECACGPCIGMGQAPPTNGVSLRTFNRNFKGRCGTSSGRVYLAGPEVAAVSAIEGYITDPTGKVPEIYINAPAIMDVDDSMIIPPADEGNKVEIVRGPNIKPFPLNKPLGGKLEGEAVLKVGDNITTDHIMPSDAKLLPLRSNIPALSEHCFEAVDGDFSRRCREKGGGFIIAGANYGQGSSREHAALVPLYLGVKGVAAKSFARIHRANLINNGILPLVFENEKDYEALEMGDVLIAENIRNAVALADTVEMHVKNKDRNIRLRLELSDRERNILLCGGLLNYWRRKLD
jgi:aconitate hydratase